MKSMDNSVKVVNLISDTMTQPTQQMKDAMYEAEVIDDERCGDDNFKRLCKKFVEMTGKEAAIYMSSGMLSNIIAVMVHCPMRHHEVILGDESDLEHCEQSSIVQVAGRSIRTAKTNKDGTYDFEELESKIRMLNNDHFPVTRLICIENTNNRCGGVVVPIEYLRKLRTFANERNLLIHMDGARVGNAAVNLGVPLSKIAEHVDSISMCLSKGVAAPGGSMLAGTKEFIQHAKYLKKLLGGAQRKTGFLAAAALVALNTMEERLKNDQRHAMTIAKAVNSVGQKEIFVDMDYMHTNIVSVQFAPNGRVTPLQFKNRIATVTEEEKEELKEDVVIMNGRCHGVGRVQLVVCNIVTDDDVALIEKKLIFVIKSLLMVNF